MGLLANQKAWMIFNCAAFVIILGIQALTDINNTQTRSLLDIHQNFKIRVHCATYVNVKELGKVTYFNPLPHRYSF